MSSPGAHSMLRDATNICVLDDDDDDVVIMGEEKVDVAAIQRCNPSKSSSTALNDVLKIIAEAKELGKETEKDMALFAEEIENMQSSLSDAVYESLKHLAGDSNQAVQIPLDWCDLKQLVFGVLEGLTAEELGDLSLEEYQAYSRKLNAIERGNQAVSKMFLDCHMRLKDFKSELMAESAAVEKEIALYEKNVSQGVSQACMLIDSDDEDVTITGSTLSSSKTQLVHRAAPAMPPMDELRSQFANAVNKSMPGLLNSLPPPPVADHRPVLQTQSRPAVAPPPVRWPDLRVGDKVLGKKFNDVWYSGSVMDVQPEGSDGNSEWKCRVKFDGKGMKVLSGKNVAYKEPINCFIRVGTRVVALYREDDAPNSFFAGVIAEAPSMKNNKRFLVFFDDGYAQYCEAKELHKVYMQSANVWDDIHPDTSAFIKEYLRIYPERPMVRLSQGQVVRTEWNGKWWTSKVQETDASLVKMYFQADKRTEWIYRGSTRLEPLFKALVNADAIKAAGSSRGRRHNLSMRPSDAGKQRPSVEYTRTAVEEDSNSNNSNSSSSKSKSSWPGKQSETKKRSNVAKKSTGGSIGATSANNIGAASANSIGTASANSIGATSANSAGADSKWEAPWLKYQRRGQRGGGPSAEAASSNISVLGNPKVVNNPGFFKAGKELSSKDIASVLQQRLATSGGHMEYDEERATGERKELTLDRKHVPRIPFKPHACVPECVKVSDQRRETHRGRSAMLVPLLCGWERQICKARPSTKRFVLYRGPCGRRLRCIEEVDRYLMLTDSQMTIDQFCFDHHLHVNTEFVPIIPVKTYCDIKDLSYGIENYPVSCVNGVDRHFPDYVEYANRRIPSKGVHINTEPDFLACCDCTDNCRDRSKCACQQMTVENTTWIGDRDPDAGYNYRRLREPLFTGIVECNSRCSCDKRCQNRVAQHGLQMRLQVFKTEKKGWGLRCLDDIAKGSFICIYAGQLLTDRGANEDGKQYGDEYLAELDFIEVVERQKEGYESDVEGMDFSDDENDANYKASKDSEEDSDYNTAYVPSVAERRRTRRRPAATEAVKEKEKEEEKTETKKTEEPMQVCSHEDPISISDEEEEEEEGSQKSGKKTEKKEGGEKTEDPRQTQEPKSKPRAKKSTGGSRYNLSTSLKTSQEPAPEKGERSEKQEYAPTRSYFEDDTDCYIMDAKSMGNLGRYLNHSCSPNVFVQNIFVDTHDLRFPWVAFFAGQYIRAGTELTWDYNYEVGSVPDKILYCYCGSSTCRGRLL